jgi:hypothetical protein
LKLQLRPPNVYCETFMDDSDSEAASDNTVPGHRAGFIDVIGHDSTTDETVLVMNQSTRWDGSNEQLHALQERFNAYASFLLDGELAESHPELAGKKMRIDVRCAHMPDDRTLELLGMIHDQLEFQGVRVEVIVADSGD